MTIPAKFFFLVLLVLFTCVRSLGQSSELFIPSTINSPVFTEISGKGASIGGAINNYGAVLLLAGSHTNKILTFTLQYNDGQIKFDPLNFNYSPFGEGTNLIASNPSKVFYTELGIGHKINLNRQYLSLQGGVGRQFTQSINKIFLQLAWGNQNELINSGATVRINYAKVKGQDLIALEPMVQGKIKLLQNLKLVNQFGYVIPLKKSHDHMAPILSLGLEYAL